MIHVYLFFQQAQNAICQWAPTSFERKKENECDGKSMQINFSSVRQKTIRM